MDDTDQTQITEIKKLSAENSAPGNEAGELESLLAKRDLELAECKYHLKTVTSMYEDITSSIIWRYTAPLRKFLDKINKNNFTAKNNAGSVKKTVFYRAHEKIRPSPGWVEVVNGCNRKVAIVACLAETDRFERHTEHLALLLVDHGYLVIYASESRRRKGSLGSAARNLHSSIIHVSLDELMKKVGHLQLQRNFLNVCFVTFPFRTLVEFLPYFRLAGFSIIFEVLSDWEALHTNGNAPWYEREFEEQTVLCADLVAAVSMQLKNRFSHLRSDIVCITSLGSTDIDNYRISDDCFEQMISEATSKSVLRDLYA